MQEKGKLSCNEGKISHDYNEKKFLTGSSFIGKAKHSSLLVVINVYQVDIIIKM